AATPEPDGSYVWQIAQSGLLSAADIVALIKEGKSYINVHTVTYPGGEISGHFNLANGTMSFTAPPEPTPWRDDHKDPRAAARFRQQATFGPTLADIKGVTTMGYANWLKKQFRMKPTGHLKKVQETGEPIGFDSSAMNVWWERSITASDQLRQRTAFA